MSGHDAGAEQAILGCVLDHPAALDHLPIGAGNFHPKHQPILQALRAAIDEHGEPNVLMVAGQLIKRDALDKIGGAQYLHELVSHKCLPSQLTWHAQIVEAATVRRTPGRRSPRPDWTCAASPRSRRGRR